MLEPLSPEWAELLAEHNAETLHILHTYVTRSGSFPIAYFLQRRPSCMSKDVLKAADKHLSSSTCVRTIHVYESWVLYRYVDSVEMPVEDSLPVSGLRFPCLSADAQPCLVEDGRLFGWRLRQHKITSPFAGLSGGHHVTSEPYITYCNI